MVDLHATLTGRGARRPEERAQHQRGSARAATVAELRDDRVMLLVKRLLFGPDWQRVRSLAPGLTSRAVIEKMMAIQMVDVCLPTTDGRLLILPRYTQPEPDQQLLLQRLHLLLPPQPLPRLSQLESTSFLELA